MSAFLHAARGRRGQAVVLALPGVALAVVGSTHPAHLTYDDARHWWVMHVVALPLFPLVGLAFAALVRGRGDVIAWAVRVLAYTYAVCYTALDVLAGIGTGYVLAGTDGVPGAASAEISRLFGIGNELARFGVYSSWRLR